MIAPVRGNATGDAVAHGALPSHEGVHMRVIDEHTITQAALEQMSGTPDPRLRQIMAALTRHLHEFTREVDLTPDEWLEGIKLLTAVGQKCTEHRQEFILLSDTLGLSALVNALHDRRG